MTVKKFIDITKSPSEEQLKMLEAMKERPIVLDDSCPELTEEQLSRAVRASDRKREKA